MRFQLLILGILFSVCSFASMSPLNFLNEKIKEAKGIEWEVEEELAEIKALHDKLPPFSVSQARLVELETGRTYGRAVQKLKESEDPVEKKKYENEARMALRMGLAVAIKAQGLADQWEHYWKVKAPKTAEVLRDAFYVAVAIGAEVSQHDAGIAAIVAVTMITVAAVIIPYKLILGFAKSWKVKSLVGSFFKGAEEEGFDINAKERVSWIERVLKYPRDLVSCKSVLRAS